jgi:hypothetical protein
VGYTCEDLDVLWRRLRQLEREIDRLLEQHEIGRLLTTIDGVGPQTSGPSRRSSNPGSEPSSARASRPSGRPACGPTCGCPCSPRCGRIRGGVLTTNDSLRGASCPRSRGWPRCGSCCTPSTAWPPFVVRSWPISSRRRPTRGSKIALLRPQLGLEPNSPLIKLARHHHLSNGLGLSHNQTGWSGCTTNCGTAGRGAATPSGQPIADCRA